MAIFMKLFLISVLFNSHKFLADTQQISESGRMCDSTDDISEIAAKILSECYLDHREIVVHSNSNRAIIRNIYQNGPFIIIVLSDSSELNKSSQLRLNKHLFLMTPNNVTQIVKTLRTFKSSTRWNIWVPFFILDKSNMECKNAKQMLRATWKMNVIESFFLCINSHRKLTIYTYNPYTNRAPSSWKAVESIPNKTNRWTMYSQPLHAENVCGGINFDRTKYLDGAIIKVGVRVSSKFKLSPYKDYNNSIIPFLYENDVGMMKKMQKSLNATLIFNVGTGNTLNDYLERGICDIVFSFEFPPKIMTYPMFQFQFHIVANDKGFYTPLENLNNYFGTPRLCLYISLPIAIIVILLSKNSRKWCFAAVKIVLMLINRSLYTRMDKIVIRVFFPALFLYFLMSQMSFLSHVMKALIAQEPRGNVETLNDLKHPRYNAIYGDWYIKNEIVGSELKQKFIVDDDCIGKVIGNDSTVCICKVSKIRESKINKKLHISHRSALIMTYYYGSREDWPLRKKFDSFFKNLESTGQLLADRNDRRDKYYLEAQKKYITELNENSGPISISMPQLICLLLIGLKLALVFCRLATNHRNSAAMTRENNQTE